MREITMAGYLDASGIYVKGIEDFVPKSQYERVKHTEKVVEDILENWLVLSQNNKFHAIFATISINETFEASYLKSVVLLVIKGM